MSTKEKADKNGSQFYVTLRDKIENLDGKHTIFGTVAEGPSRANQQHNTTLVFCNF